MTSKLDPKYDREQFTMKPVEKQYFELWDLIHRTRHALFTARTKELSQFGVLPRQVAALHIIKSINGPATPAEISRRMFRRPHSISGLLNRMEKEGLIRKAKDMSRKNMVRVTLTEKGEKLYDLSTKRELMHRVFSNLSDEQCKQLMSSLKIILNKAYEEPGVVRELHPYSTEELAN
ncbi:MarR family winged helix-turn-helix transcriptional regulator [Chloroflexota bacterium]